MSYTLTAIIAALIFYRIGVEVAHETIAHECKTLGAFYVVKDVFKCVEWVDRQ